MRTGWKVVGSDAERQIVEYKATEEKDQLLPYGEAKHIALEQLRSHIAPYLAKIEEIERDVFHSVGALPPLKAWSRGYGKWNHVVTAKTKKRAREIVSESKYGFDTGWKECSDYWWYRLASHEAIWVEDQDVFGRGNGKFRRCLTRQEAATILDEHITPYRTIAARRLLPLVGEDREDSEVTSFGTPYKIKTTIRRNYRDDSKLHVECQIEDGQSVIWHPVAHVERVIPQDELVSENAWTTEGF